MIILPCNDCGSIPNLRIKTYFHVAECQCGKKIFSDREDLSDIALADAWNRVNYPKKHINSDLKL